MSSPGGAQSPCKVGVAPAPSFLTPAPPPSKPPSIPRGPRNGLRAGAAPPQRRRSSFTGGGSGGGGCPRGGSRRRRTTSDCEPVLPCKFLLGGNIFDPLNLNSLLDEEVNRALNAASPEPLGGPHRFSSPPAPPPQPPSATSSANRDPAVRILRPRDITDPLCLTCDPSGETAPGRSRKRHRPHRHSQPPQPPLPPTPDPRAAAASSSRFQYGNYRRYYGYRTPARSEDPRLRLLMQRPHWIRGRALLDLGCNEGRLALSLARSLRPARLLGLDIDPALVRCARRNLRREQGQEQRPAGAAAFPQALAACRGPIAAPPLPPQPGGGEPDAHGHDDFPHNVYFVQGNYVLERDELLETQSPEFDVILCLSLTKWVHLNWGDEGLKRMFKRIYRHLHPGGILILEPQPWASYGKRKKLTETIFKNYQQITLKPDQFTSYLLSPEVGFSTYELLGTPQTSSKGFQRPIYAFHKGSPVEEK
ncbi:7SK snRNA methylphosphate capping enzyme [Microcaecilia unicolor]|uniref:RNA methyltransferase n=1 Tax=Microcaecilia unicolor TaxID=1415580 RepID=A0A6P7WY09_9AMPH|nr:7SK snRNA methylphosphate capping enzyme [Microcaecilia unicolor]XP_030043161.1 7SK snRNA methylphosphate capping enzyme [Microcaecilia unicolor]